MAQQMDLTAELRPVLQWFSRHFNPHRFFIFLSLVLFLVAWNRGIALLYGMVSLLLALLAISYLLPPINIRKLQVKMPGRLQCHAGDTLEMKLKLYSYSPCQHISIGTDDPFHAGIIEEPAFVAYVKGEVGAHLRLMCNRRGDYAIERLVASSDYPFGIHTARRSIGCTRCRLLVYPKTFHINALPSPGSRSYSLHGQRNINQPHSDEEYAGVREYRHGDNLKHIHWGASARHQELIVREFESYDQPAMLIILNCNQQDEHGTAPDSCFEYSIEIAASLMLYASRQAIAVELIAEGKQGFHLNLAPGENLSDYHYGQFAQMKADGSRDYWQHVTAVCSRFHHIDTVVTFSPQQTLAAQVPPGKKHIDICFDQHSFDSRRLQNAADKVLISDNRLCYRVQWGCDLERLFNESQ